LEDRENEHEKKVRRLLENFESKMIELADSNDLLQNEAVRYRLKIEELEDMVKKSKKMDEYSGSYENVKKDMELGEKNRVIEEMR
jgi:hypothetical protein